MRLFNCRSNNFYKYATFPKTMKAKMNEYLNDSKTKQWGDGQKIDDTGELKKTLLVYGDFDRLSLEAVKSFHRYRDVEKYAQRWLGPRQSILLYQLADLSDTDLLEEIFRKVSPEEVANNADTYRNFVVFTMITLDSTLHKASDFSKALHACADLIGTVVDAYKDEILDEPEAFKYQVYGSFSSSELVIVWSANQYTDALQMTNLLRDVSFQLKGCKDKGFELKELRPFSSFYSVVAQEKPRKQDGEVGKEIKGDAELRFVFQEGDSSSEDRRKFPKRFLDKLKEKIKLSEDEISTISLYPSVGEYDYCMRMPAKYLCSPYNNIFRRNGLLHWDNSAFKDIIATTHVQLYYVHDGLEADNLPKNVPLSIISPSDIQHMDDADMVIKLDAIKDQTYHGKNSAEIIQNSYLKKYRKNGLRDFIKECFPKTDGLCDTLDLLFSDYVNNCSNLTNPSWANDLTTQFSEMLDYIATQLIVCFSKNSIRDKVNVFRRIKQISSVFIQMIYHISQSRRTIFIVPSCHIRYMGQYDMILHAYYGLEKYLLKLAYKLPHDDLQPTLVPIFTIDVIPEIRTDMYKVTYHFDDERKTSAIFELTCRFQL